MSTINLLPEDYKQRRSQHRGNTICMILFGVVIFAIGGAALVSEQSGQNTRNVGQRVDKAYAEAARLIDEMHELEAQKRKMLQKAELSAALMERLPRSYVLALVTNALPEGASLTSLSMSTSALKTSSAKARTKHARMAKQRKKNQPPAPRVQVAMTLDGWAATDVQVARLIANLAKNPLTEMVDLAYSQETKHKEDVIRKFRLIVRLKLNADALDAIQAAAEEHARTHTLPPDRGPGGDA
jgi:hypothetical protein